MMLVFRLANWTPIGDVTPTEGTFYIYIYIYFFPFFLVEQCSSCLCSSRDLQNWSQCTLKLFGGSCWSTTLLVGFSIDFPKVQPMQTSKWPHYVPGVKGQWDSVGFAELLSWECTNRQLGVSFQKSFISLVHSGLEEIKSYSGLWLKLVESVLFSVGDITENPEIVLIANL